MIEFLKVTALTSLVATAAQDWTVGITAAVAVGTAILTFRIQLFRLMRSENKELKDQLYDERDRRLEAEKELAVAEARVKVLEERPDLTQLGSQMIQLLEIVKGLERPDG